MSAPARGAARAGGSRTRRRPSIEPRNRRFAVRGARMASWHSDNLYISHFFNALSLMFPEGERFFVDSVRRLRHRITDPDLQAEVGAFIQQEAVHAREHRQYNAALRRQGYPIGVFDLVTGMALWSTRLTPARWQLAITCAFEHFTATLADAALREPEVLGNAAADYAELWRWHSAEEVEHKAVAFEVYQAVAPGILGYLMRVAAMAAVTANYLPYAMVQQLTLAAFDRLLLDPRAAAGALRFFWTRPGLISRRLLPYLRYYKPSFHPWEHDNTDLLERWRQSTARPRTRA